MHSGADNVPEFAPMWGAQVQRCDIYRIEAQHGHHARERRMYDDGFLVRGAAAGWLLKQGVQGPLCPPAGQPQTALKSAFRGFRTENPHDTAGGSPPGRRHPRRLSPTPRRHSVRRRRQAGKRTSVSRWPPSDTPIRPGDSVRMCGARSPLHHGQAKAVPWPGETPTRAVSCQPEARESGTRRKICRQANMFRSILPAAMYALTAITFVRGVMHTAA